jgi:hypothetical protein
MTSLRVLKMGLKFTTRHYQKCQDARTESEYVEATCGDEEVAGSIGPAVRLGQNKRMADEARPRCPGTLAKAKERKPKITVVLHPRSLICMGVNLGVCVNINAYSYLTQIWK